MPHPRRLPRALAVALLAALPVAALPATTAQGAIPESATMRDATARDAAAVRNATAVRDAAAVRGPAVRSRNATAARAVSAARAVTATRAVTAGTGERAVAGGRLDWGIKASFQSYVTGPIAKGRWALNGGAATAGQSQFRFHSASGTYAPGSGTFEASFSGGVRFTGHKKPDGTKELDLTVSRPTVRIAGASGTLFADIRSKAKGSGRTTSRAQVPLASLRLSGVNMRGGKGPIALTDVPATLTAEGAKSFAGYYTAGTPLDPVSLSADLKAQPQTKPGEKPGEKAGEKKGAGRIEDAAVDWGVRRTFREYVTGSLAKGTWKLTDGAQDGGALFRFGQGKGEYDTEDGVLKAELAGAVRFTGKHLDLALSDVSVRVKNGEGTLYAQVKRDGKATGTQPLVTFSAKKAALKPDAKGLVTLTEAPAKLTSDGARAFGGMYAKGTAMDPVSLAVALDDKAKLPALPDLGSGASASAEQKQRADLSDRAGEAASAASSMASTGPLIAAGAGVAVLAAAGIGFAVLRRKRGATPPG
ncbi:HtaA domain-containing protein [Streptomyces iconiensis]|uniref:HtaA domain-containing protein n=1 Tax=Streptomyces iconiensis TaxID=1384038 RepID=A0ABT6ZWR8_9ACTN|nr:HtaA domain-containing protein [Streptomyces iconiensis]MDJ1133499.1 HtaA domain-containing protein [Streptomyces iconiensis]